MTKSSASHSDVIVVLVGMNMDCLDVRSTMTRIELYPLEFGSSSIKSIDIESHGQIGTGSGLRRPRGRCRLDLFRPQIVQELT